MTIRVNGANGGDRLGYFQGDNAIVHLAVKTAAASVADRIDFAETGVVTKFEDFMVLHEFAATVGHTVSPGVFTNISAEARTINGVTYATEATYRAAYAAQANLRLVVDTVQQRSVIIATRGEALTIDTANDSWTEGLTSSNLTFTTATANNDAVSVVSFLIERATVWDEAFPNQYGQPTTGDEGGILVDALTALSGSFMLPDGGLVSEEASAAPFETAAHVSKQLPLISFNG